jgi:PncC family amidohydrolase
MAEAASLAALGAAVGARLRARGESVAVAESSSGGLISATLLAVPGASAFYRGGVVVYWGANKETLLRIAPAELVDPHPSTEGHALLLARRVRTVIEASWGIGETGTAGPTGSRYGNPAGYGCYAVAGPAERTGTVETGHADRAANMQTFAAAALRLLLAALDAEG